MAKRIRLTLSFGSHGTRNDSQELRQILAKGKFDIFVDEAREMPDDRRRAYILKANELQKKLSRLSNGNLPKVDDSFDDGLVDVLTSAGLRFFIVESHSADEIRLLRAMHEGRDELIPRIFSCAVFSYQVDEALRQTRSYLYGSAEYLRLRNEAIVRGFANMPNELGEFFPELGEEVNVLARFGSHHYAIGDELRSQRFDVEFGEMRFGGIARILVKMSGDVGYFPSEEEVAEAMFSILHKGMCTGDERQAFVRIGEVEGFLKFLDYIAGTRDAGEKFTHMCSN